MWVLTRPVARALLVVVLPCSSDCRSLPRRGPGAFPCRTYARRGLRRLTGRHAVCVRCCRGDELRGYPEDVRTPLAPHRREPVRLHPLVAGGSERGGLCHRERRQAPRLWSRPGLTGRDRWRAWWTRRSICLTVARSASWCAERPPGRRCCGAMAVPEADSSLFTSDQAPSRPGCVSSVSTVPVMACRWRDLAALWAAGCPRHWRSRTTSASTSS